MVAEIERAYYHPAPYLVFQAGEMRDFYPALSPGENVTLRLRGTSSGLRLATLPLYACHEYARHFFLGSPGETG